MHVRWHRHVCTWCTFVIIIIRGVYQSSYPIITITVTTIVIIACWMQLIRVNFLQHLIRRIGRLNQRSWSHSIPTIIITIMMMHTINSSRIRPMNITLIPRHSARLWWWEWSSPSIYYVPSITIITIIIIMCWWWVIVCVYFV